MTTVRSWLCEPLGPCQAGKLLKKSLDDFRQCVKRDEHDEMDKVLKTVDGAERQIAILERIPTWPWQPGTLRGVVTALFLPILLWLITRILERLIVF